MPIYILLGKVRTLLEWADALLCKKIGVDGVDGYNLDCDDYWSTCGANTKFSNTLEYLSRNKLN